MLEPASIRSMFVRVSPIPRSLSERRAVLRALQKYGEIEVFKSLIVRHTIAYIDYTVADCSRNPPLSSR